MVRIQLAASALRVGHDVVWVGQLLMSLLVFAQCTFYNSILSGVRPIL